MPKDPCKLAMNYQGPVRDLNLNNTYTLKLLDIVFFFQNDSHLLISMGSNAWAPGYFFRYGRDIKLHCLQVHIESDILLGKMQYSLYIHKV